MAQTIVGPEALRVVCDPEALGFADTATLEPLGALIGQDRAVEAIGLAAQIGSPRFNLFVLGPEGSGRHTSLRALLNGHAARRPVPDDWVYVQDFDQPERPRALRLPAGMGPRLRAVMGEVIEDLAGRIPAVLVSEEHQNRRAELDQRFADRRDAAYERLRRAAEARGIAIIQTPTGFSIAPVRDGELMKPEAIAALSEAERGRIDRDLEATRRDLNEFLLSLPELTRDRQKALAALNTTVAARAVDAALAMARQQLGRRPRGLAAHFRALREDLVAHAELFVHAAADDGGAFAPRARAVREDPRFRRYDVNVVVSHPEAARGAPVVEETLPTLGNLIGRLDHVAQQGMLSTDFTLIRAGALHRANGGFLILDARRLLSEPFAWDALKRCLETRSIRLTTPEQRLGLFSTATLEPEPIPLDVRIVLVGPRELHRALTELDPDFGQHFRVQADFADEVARTPSGMAQFARLIATVARDEGLRPVSAAGVAALIDAATRAAGDQGKLSLRMGPTLDLLREADHIARRKRRPVTDAADVDAAVQATLRRAGLPRERMHELLRQGTLAVATAGSVVGQVNALSVVEAADSRFGLPMRVTARVRMGQGRIVDIQREAELSGPIHSKAVLILTGFLAARYAPDAPLSLWASLVAEQTYGVLEGDSASLAELCALLSALAGVPLSQSFAVTGSVDQMGAVQAVGGLDEKIEGFFDLCAAGGLTGRQGVIIPAANRRNLMLRRDVVEAVAAGRFTICAVDHVDDAIERLTGLPAGWRAVGGGFEEGSVNGNVETRLHAFAEAARAQGAGGPQDMADPG